jgi:hypothetical protein
MHRNLQRAIKYDSLQDARTSFTRAIHESCRGFFHVMPIRVGHHSPIVWRNNEKSHHSYYKMAFKVKVASSQEFRIENEVVWTNPRINKHFIY